MDLRHLAVFVAIAETGTLTAAGQRLHLVQSGISTTLRALEADVGAPLFERTARQAVLTDVGRVLLPLARSTLAAALEAREVAREASAGLRGPLTVGVMGTMARLDLPRLLARSRELHPHIDVSVHAVMGGSRGLLRAVRDGELDLAFAAPATDPGPGLHLRPLAQVHLQLVLPHAHPLAGRDEVGLAELTDDPWVDFPVGFGNRDVVDAAFARAGLTRHIALELVDVPSVSAYVEHGLGLAFVPDYLPFDRSRLYAPRLREGPLVVTVSLVTATRCPHRAVVATWAAFVEAELAARAG